MKKRRFIAFLCVTLLLFAINPGIVSGQGSFGENEPAYIGIQPLWVNVAEIWMTLSFSGTTAHCTVMITALPETTSISGTVTLERRIRSGTYEYVRSWPISSSSSVLNFTNSAAVTRGNTYRLSVTAQVTRRGFTETVSMHVVNRN